MPRHVSKMGVMPALLKTRVTEECLDNSFCDEALPLGTIITDVQLKKWRIGKPTGRGSFGQIYLASDDVEKDVTEQNARYVVKMEPHTNGPLFVEIHCLIRTAQVAKVKAWRLQNKLKRIGMPLFIANGSFTDENTNTKYRFLVLPRYSTDLQKIIARTKILDLKNVLLLSLQILDVLEYLHSHGYAHSDIKSSNLMIGFDGNIFVKAAPKYTPFLKESKNIVPISSKHRKTRTVRSRPSNYCNGDDHTVEEDHQSSIVKQKLRKMVSDSDNRRLRFPSSNLRQLSNYVNNEDLSSACSDKCYQKNLADCCYRTSMCVVENLKCDVKTEELHDLEINMNEIYKEAILSQSNKQIYLLDYGLATKFLDCEGNHKDFVMDARKAHDGTLEYSSRDSHVGAHSRRSDLESLGYNMLDWLTGNLPWKTAEVLAEPDLVHALKNNYMSDVKTLLQTCFNTKLYPPVMEKYLQYVTSLDYTKKPDYDYCRNLFRSELIKNGFISDRESLNISDSVIAPEGIKIQYYSKRFCKKNTPRDFVARNGIKKASQRENVCSLQNNLKQVLLKQSLCTSSSGMRKPFVSRNFFISDADLIKRLKKSLLPHEVHGKILSPKSLRSKKKNTTKCNRTRRCKNNLGKFGNFMGSDRQFSWAEILAGNPERIIRKERHATNNEYKEENDDTVFKYKIGKSDASHRSCNDAYVLSPLLQEDYLHGLNPTYAMKEVLANLKKKLSGKSVKEQENCPPGLEGFTPAMIKLYKSKEKREATEKLDMLKQNLERKELKTQRRRVRSMTSFLTENNIPPNLMITNNPGYDNVNTSEIDSHELTISSNSNNQIPLRVKGLATKKKIFNELIDGHGRATGTGSRNCNQTRSKKTKKDANNKHIDCVTNNDDNVNETIVIDSCVASVPYKIRNRRTKSVTTYDYAAKYNDQKTDSELIDAYNGMNDTLSISSTSIKSENDRIRTLRTRSVGSKIQVKNMTSSNNCEIQQIQTVAKTVPLENRTSNRIRTRSSTADAPKDSSVANVMPILASASKSMDQFKKHSKKNVTWKEPKVYINWNNCLTNTRDGVEAASTKYTDTIPAKITRSFTNKEINVKTEIVEAASSEHNKCISARITRRLTNKEKRSPEENLIKMPQTIGAASSEHEGISARITRSATNKGKTSTDENLVNTSLAVGPVPPKLNEYIPARITRSVIKKEIPSAHEELAEEPLVIGAVSTKQIKDEPARINRKVTNKGKTSADENMVEGPLVIGDVSTKRSEDKPARTTRRRVTSKGKTSADENLIEMSQVKREEDIPVRITRSVTNKMKTSSDVSSVKPTTTRNNVVKVVSNRRRLKGRKRKKTG